MIREKLQAGFGRTIGSILGGVGSFCFLYFVWDSLIGNKANPLDAGQKVAFVAAAFAVTAYNLRTRVIDLIMRLDGESSRVVELCAIARNCGLKLTNLVLLFTMTAFILGAGGFIPLQHPISKWYACFAVSMFGSSVIQFIYVIFAFERLERFMLDEVEFKGKDKEVDRLINHNIRP
jgi:hypothetical protein